MLGSTNFLKIYQNLIKIFNQNPTGKVDHPKNQRKTSVYQKRVFYHFEAYKITQNII